VNEIGVSLAIKFNDPLSSTVEGTTIAFYYRNVVYDDP
jgi:hypothetical protein